ncbi:TauD/TfdA family dioxygenase [Dermatobacter hominis]|uniref:TauD/TfdA family dioxygenase n=1 Tax=Dermatobacter hominis TaxID=2884263 RepID=UPI001D12DA09|nr:TauD/TfdA family dioxygenase [Dermatobacter hominis]UDY34713.1 TauD/TfdA family dioxygenase [Dermatobacter hominis]
MADNDLVAVGTVPERLDDPVAVRRALRTTGAVVVPGPGSAPDPMTALVRSVLGDEIRSIGDHVPVRAAGGRDRPDLDADGHTLTTPLHSDGFSLAEGAPDVLVLGCVHPAADGGGASFLVDLDAVVGRLAAGDDADRELATFLLDTDVDQTEPGRPTVIGPIGRRLDGDRTAWTRSIFLQPAPDDPDPARTRRLLDRWEGLLADLTDRLPRFHLGAGDALVVDNTRLLHGRDPYEDRDRLLWRLWVWTDRAVRPDTAYAVSDASMLDLG